VLILDVDFTSANILLQLANIDEWTVGEIYERLGKPQTQDLHRSPDGPADSPAPRYTVNAISMKGVDPQWLSDQIIIIDFGIAFLQNESSPYIGTPKSYCAPEFLFGNPRSVSSDIWALGCTIFEIRTGSGLFKYRDVTPTRDHILMGMVNLLGSFPQIWWGRWDNGREWCANLEETLGGALYDQIMEIGKFDGDALAPRPIRKNSSTKPVSSSEMKLNSSEKLSLGSTNRLIALVEDLTTDEAAEVMELANKPQSNSSSENKDNSLSSNKKNSNSGSSNAKSGEKSISSEGVSTGKGAHDARVEPVRNLIGRDGMGLEGSAKDATATSHIKDFLEPAGTKISAIEAEGLENLLRKALRFLPEERLAPSELAKHHWFFDDFETKIMESAVEGELDKEVDKSAEEGMEGEVEEEVG
jgi:serine/threonine-protein kinase SRPK3